MANEKSKSTNKVLIILLLLITVTAVAVTVWALFIRDTTPVLAPDYAPQETADNAQLIGDGDETKLAQPEGGGAVSLTYSNEVSISLKDKTATLLFQNPSKSNQDMVLQIVIDDVVIAQTGTLSPGYKIDSVPLLGNAELSAGTYNGKFNVLYYDKESGEKAILNTEIPVSITVS